LRNVREIGFLEVRKKRRVPSSRWDEPHLLPGLASTKRYHLSI